MTASIKIFNTSNWDGENVVLPDGEVLKPGEGKYISPIDFDKFNIKKKQEDNIKPIMKSGEQIFPLADMRWKSSSGAVYLRRN